MKSLTGRLRRIVLYVPSNEASSRVRACLFGYGGQLFWQAHHSCSLGLTSRLKAGRTIFVTNCGLTGVRQWDDAYERLAQDEAENRTLYDFYRHRTVQSKISGREFLSAAILGSGDVSYVRFENIQFLVVYPMKNGRCYGLTCP